MSVDQLDLVSLEVACQRPHDPPVETGLAPKPMNRNTGSAQFLSPKSRLIEAKYVDLEALRKCSAHLDDESLCAPGVQGVNDVRQHRSYAALRAAHSRVDDES